MVHLVALGQPAEDRDRVLDAGLADGHRLKAALQGGVLLHVLAVLGQGGGPDAAQLAAGQGGLEHVGRVGRALGRAGAHYGVQLVDEEDDLAVGVGHFFDERLEPLFELAAELGAGHQRAEVQRDHPLVLEALGHVAGGDAPGQALGDGGLAHAGLADQHGVVLGAPGEHLHHPADLLVAADDRVELALPGHLGEVAPVALQGAHLLLGLLVGDPRRPAQLGEGLEDFGLVGALALERAGRGALAL